MNTEPTTPLRDRITKLLQEHTEEIRPRWYFVLIGILSTLATLLLICLTLFLMSFVFFIINQESIAFVPTFGLSGAIAALFALPWIIITLIIAFVIILEIFLRRISFAYRRPIIYSLAAVLILTVFGGLGIAKTELHETLKERSERMTLPLVRPLYSHYGNTPASEELAWGRIKHITADGFTLEHPEHHPLFVSVTKQTKLAPNTTLTEGALVSVFGTQQENTIIAEGIRAIPKPEKKLKRFLMK